MDKFIEKKYEMSEDSIILSYVDTRDNYIYESSLGEIGNIFLSNTGIFIYPIYGHDLKESRRREEKLYQALKEIFATEEINPLSSEYYETIKNMINDGSLELLGYTLNDLKEHDKEIDFNFMKPRRR